MESRRSNEEDRLDREIERYRAAAAAALEQLEWSISYLRGIRKPEIARALERNRKRILRDMS